MANNLMYLVHVPTGLAVYLGKRMAFGWYMSGQTQTRMGDRVTALFEAVRNAHYDGYQDDFAVALEDVERATLATGAWKFGPERTDGLVQLVINKEVPDA